MEEYLLSRRADPKFAFVFSKIKVPQRTRVSNSNTLKRTLCTLAFVFLLVQSASAQSVLNFSRVLLDSSNTTGIAITNPGSYYADVLLTFYGLDGNPIQNGVLNPTGRMNYRLAPKTQVQVLASELFDGGEGWIQATSPTSGLMGFYFTGDFNSTLDGSPSVAAMTSQVLPLIREDVTAHTDLLITNPGSATANVVLNFSDPRGVDIGTVSQSIPAHGVYKFHPANSFPIFGSSGTSVRVTSNLAVLATAVVTGADTVFINGQAMDQSASTRIIPHFLSGNGADSQIVLMNPNTFSVNATVTLFSQSGGAVIPGKTGLSVVNVSIAPHGEAALGGGTFAGQPAIPLVNGWVQIDTANVP